MTTTIKGEDTNQVIYSLDDALEENSLLVNTIGNYKGTTLLDDDGSETKRLKVEVEGALVIVLDPITSARELNDSAKGSKDDVLLYRSGDAAILNFTSTGGDSNVAYWSTDDGTTLWSTTSGSSRLRHPGLRHESGTLRSEHPISPDGNYVWKGAQWPAAHRGRPSRIGGQRLQLRRLRCPVGASRAR